MVAADPEAWAMVVRAILDGSLYPDETRLRGREFVVANHSLSGLISPIAPILEFVASPREPM